MICFVIAEHYLKFFPDSGTMITGTKFFMYRNILEVFRQDEIPSPEVHFCTKLSHNTYSNSEARAFFNFRLDNFQLMSTRLFKIASVCEKFLDFSRNEMYYSSQVLFYKHKYACNSGVQHNCLF